MDHCPDFDGVEIKIIAASSGAAAFLNDSSTGAFSFDADGNGVGAAIGWAREAAWAPSGPAAMRAT